MQKLFYLSVKVFFISLAVKLSVYTIEAQSFKDMFISKEDGAVDMSEFLNSNTGFLPVPIIITEPAVGFGGGLALAYFHKGETFENEGAKGLSPTVSFAAGAYASDGTLKCDKFWFFSKISNQGMDKLYWEL